MHLHHTAGTLPDDFFLMPEDYAFRFYRSYLHGLFAEAMPGSSLMEYFTFAAAGVNDQVERIFGLFPDLQSAREMTALSRGTVCEILRMDLEDLDFVEAGLVPLSISRALLLCRSLDWPLAALFRNGVELHHGTALRVAHREMYGEWR